MPHARLRRIAAAILLGVASPALAQVTVHGGHAPAPRLADGFALEAFADTASPGAAFRLTEAGPDSLLFTAPAGCTLRLEDRDGDGGFETRRARQDGRLVPRCAPTPDGFARTSAEAGPDAVEPLADCRFETLAAGGVICQPTRFGRAAGEAWSVVDAMRAGELIWRDGLVLLDADTGRLWRLVPVEEGEAEPRPTTFAENIPTKPTLPRANQPSPLAEHVSDTRAAVLDKQREAYPNVFRDTPEETPQAARAFKGPAARTARRNRRRAQAADQTAAD